MKEEEIGLNYAEEIKRLDGRIDDLHHSIQDISRKVDELYEILRLDQRVKQLMGQNRFNNCIYSVQGYCEEEGHAVGPKTAGVNTVKKDGKYYPQITSINCQVCDRYFFGKK